MKRLVLAALAIAAMAACTKSNVQLEQPGEITLQPVAQKATKAALDGTYYPTDEAYNFNVWAWWGDYQAGTDLSYFSVTTPYIEQGKFIARNNVSWGGETPYYWPTKGSLVFAGYSPASAKREAPGAPVFTYNIGTHTFNVTDYVQPTEIAETKDLMWFDVTDESYDKNGTAGVPVTFKHALSWLTFKFVLNSAITNHTWKITNVVLKDVNTKGSFVATKSADVANAGTWTLSGESFDKEDMIVYNSASHTVSTTATTLENTENGVVVIPQDCVQLYVEYTLTASTGEDISQNVTLDLATGIDDGEWLPGKHYIYTIIFGANEILIAPEVADWVDEQVNIPVQK